MNEAKMFRNDPDICFEILVSPNYSPLFWRMWFGLWCLPSVCVPSPIWRICAWWCWAWACAIIASWCLAFAGCCSVWAPLITGGGLLILKKGFFRTNADSDFFGVEQNVQENWKGEKSAAILPILLSRKCSVGHILMVLKHLLLLLLLSKVLLFLHLGVIVALSNVNPCVWVDENL